MDSIFHDFRHGLRLFVARPAFTAVTVLVLAVGIGASTSIFTAVTTLLVRPLPVADADRVVFGLALREGTDPFGTSLLEYAAYRRSPTLATSGVAIQRAFNLIGRDEPERLQAASISATYLETLRVTPIAGRTLTPDDDRPNATPVALISYGLWQRRFGGAATAVGSRITLDDGSYTIVGVMPPAFDMPDESEIWIPLRAPIDTLPVEERAQHAYAMIARLASGVTTFQADADLKRIARRLEDEYPRHQRGWTYQLIPLRQQLLGDLAGRHRQSLLALEAAVAFLLLICCANVANLLLVRGVSRQHEIAVRRALGAGRGRVVRQLLAESSCLAIAGGAAGLLLAVWLTPVVAMLNPVRPTSFATVLTDFAIDARVMCFALAVSMLTGLLFGIVPALKAARNADVMLALTQRSGAAAGRRWLGAIVVIEIAVAVVLLVNGSLVVQSFMRLQDVDLGFEPGHLLTMQLTPQSLKYPAPADRVAFVDRIIAQLAAVPGVTSAGIATNMPLQHLSQDTAFTVEGRPRSNPADVPITAHRLVTPAYLQTLRVRLVSGRLLNEHDRAGTLPVVVVTETLARQAWPDEAAIGRRIRRGRAADTQFPWLTVVGVVADVKEDRFNFRIDRPAWYLPYAQQTGTAGSLSLVVRTEGDPSAMTPAVRSAIRAVDTEQSVSSVVTMTDHVAGQLSTERFTAVLMTLLASIGLALAAFGLYGVVAYSATQRTVEIGLRMALGARSGDVVRLVISQAAGLVAIGLAIGWLCARALSAALAGILFGVDAADPATFAAMAIVLAAAGLVACWLPAWRAARLDPMSALRAD